MEVIVSERGIASGHRVKQSIIVNIWVIPSEGGRDVPNPHGCGQSGREGHECLKWSSDVPLDLGGLARNAGSVPDSHLLL